MLPYVPQPYPDEILGSWLARVALQNGNGVWRPLMEAAGYGTKLQSPLFDLVSHDERLDYLLEACGTTYEHALKTRTTVLFWCSLSGSAQVTVPGASSLPMPTQRGKVLKKLSGLGVSRSHGAALARWHCSDCLAEDLERGHQPYWRRSHQLPTVHYCTQHWLPLQSDCQFCGASTRSGTKNSLGVLERNCICGADRRTRQVMSIEVPQAIKELCILSSQTLTLESITWNHGSIRDVWRSKLVQAQIPRRASMISILTAKYPQSIQNAYGIAVPTPGTNRHLVFHAASSRPTASATAALLVAAGLSLKEAVDSLRNSKPSTNKNRHANSLGVVRTGNQISDARSLFLLKVAKTSRLPSQLGSVYWILRLHDPDWLAATAGDRYRVHSPIPSIEDDRRVLRQNLGSSLKPTSGLGTGPATVRARIRDSEWWSSFKAERKETRTRIHIERIDSAAKMRRRAIAEAIEKLLASLDRPVRITYGLLGQHTGMTPGQVMLQVTKDPELFSALARANSTKIQRQLDWALRALISENAPISTVTVFRKAGLPHTPETTPYVRNIISASYVKRQ